MRALLDQVDHVLLDVDGVLCLGDQPFPGVAAAVAALRRCTTVVVTTNDSRRSPRQQRDRLRAAGVTDDVPVVTSVDAVVARLSADGIDRAAVVGTPGLAATLRDRGIEVAPDAGAVVVGCLVDPSTLDLAALQGHDDALWLATNADRTVPTATGPIPDTGAVLDRLAALGRVSVEVCGKPSPWMTAAVRSRHQVGRALVIGDGVDTDLAWAATEGWSALHVAGEGATSATSARVTIASLAELIG